MAAQLATVWSLIEGAPLAAERGDEPPRIPEPAIAGVRRTLEEMTGSYLRRRGKRRYCDKSLGTARWAELLLRVFPGAKFLCLYRHPMDVIASGIEACPFGLRGYGFDPYIAASPGNSVLALSRFWAENAGAILAAEERFASCAYRIRYEDLVADPENVAGGIFGFLGVPGQPGISERCFAAGQERSGPADYKIWHTSRISDKSIGRGRTLPAGMIPPPVLEAMNELTARLGYLPVDDAWGAASVPADLRLHAAGDTASHTASAVLPEAQTLGHRLKLGLSRLDELIVKNGELVPEESFGIIATPSPGRRGDNARWRVDLAARTAQEMTAGRDEEDDTDWDVVGSADAWYAVLTGRTNLGVALRRCDLRYCDAGESGQPKGDQRLTMLSALLSLDVA